MSVSSKNTLRIKEEKMVNKYTINFTKGDTYALAVKFKNLSYDLDSALFTARDSLGGNIILQASLGDGIELVDDRPYKNEKTYKIQLESSKTANLDPSVKYVYDFRVSVGNVVQTIMSGTLVTHPDVSPLETSISSDTIEAEVEDELDADFSVISSTVYTVMPRHSQPAVSEDDIDHLYGDDSIGWYCINGNTSTEKLPLVSADGYSLEVEKLGTNYNSSASFDIYHSLYNSYIQTLKTCVNGNFLIYIRKTEMAYGQLGYYMSGWGDWVQVYPASSGT